MKVRHWEFALLLPTSQGAPLFLLRLAINAEIKGYGHGGIAAIAGEISVQDKLELRLHRQNLGERFAPEYAATDELPFDTGQHRFVPHLQHLDWAKFDLLVDLLVLQILLDFTGNGISLAF